MKPNKNRISRMKKRDSEQGRRVGRQSACACRCDPFMAAAAGFQGPQGKASTEKKKEASQPIPQGYVDKISNLLSVSAFFRAHSSKSPVLCFPLLWCSRVRCPERTPLATHPYQCYVNYIATTAPKNTKTNLPSSLPGTAATANPNPRRRRAPIAHTHRTHLPNPS